MPRDARAEAAAVFPDVVVPRDFDQVEVPFRERGEPRLIRGGDDGAAQGRADASESGDGPLTSPGPG